MKDNKKVVELLTSWIDDESRETWGKVPNHLKKHILDSEAVMILADSCSGDITHQGLSDYREKFNRELDRQEQKKRNHLKEIRTWVYPIAAPLAVTIITFLLINPYINPPLPPSPILDISVQDIFDAPVDRVGSIPFLIKNPNPFSIVIHSISYEFSWTDFSPPNIKYEPVRNPSIIIPGENATEYSQISQVILSPAGGINESIPQKLSIKTPDTAGLYWIKIIIKTDKGSVEKRFFISVMEPISGNLTISRVS